MEERHKQIKQGIRGISRLLGGVFALVMILCIFILYLMSHPDAFLESEQEQTDAEVVIDEDVYDIIENGIHVRTGLVEGEGLMEVVNNCTNCHSSQLVIQNRMNKERWATTIDWMQETQGLWDLGNNEEVIINYLVTNYPPLEKGRRQPLTNIEWYVLGE